MIKRKSWIFGAATLGLLLAAPVQAAPDFLNGAFVIAKRDQAEETRPDKRELRRDERRDPRREVERDEPRGYGYGYERRQQRQDERDDRPRDRH